ncbi:MAG: DnaA regulatory inactivator Hda [Gammaproteobacteria bacterium]|nr:MAG: DnaA regulatory inactivator Hda [Gammaproteobacteria bacterium]
MRLKEENSFDNFYVADKNKLALASINQCLQEQGDWFLYLWGGHQAGLTHVLQACCRQMAVQNELAFYLPMDELVQSPTDILDNLETYQLVCIDNIDCVANEPAWQEALFHLYNKIKQHNGRLIVSSHCAPALLDFSLSDLKSRLSAGTTFNVHALDDVEKMQALKQRFLLRGLKANDEVLNFVLRRSDRNMAALMDTLEQLDGRAFDERRKLTIPFVKEVMNW